jgi:hypothetical protein
MLYSVKKLLGIGHNHKTRPVLLDDVNPAPEDPVRVQKVDEAVSNLVGSLAELERRSYLLRRELSSLAIHIVNKDRH